MLTESQMEAEALERQFRALTRRLSLDESEVRLLTHMPASEKSTGSPQIYRETCMRLLLRLEALLVALKGEDELVQWLRCEELGQTPLAFLSDGPDCMRAMILAAQSSLRSGQFRS